MSYTPTSIRTIVFPSLGAVTIVRDFFPLDLVAPSSVALTEDEQYKYRMSHGNRGVTKTESVHYPDRIWEQDPSTSSEPIPVALYAIFLLDLWCLGANSPELRCMVSAFFKQTFSYLLPGGESYMPMAAKCCDEHVAYCVSKRLPLLSGAGSIFPSSKKTSLKRIYPISC
jgi:hypothetical protein